MTAAAAIPLRARNGDVRAWAIVDATDYAALAGHRWSPGTYAVRKVRSNVAIFMHRQIMGEPAGYVVDHINGDTLDNRRCNLRVATLSENAANRRRHRNNRSGVTGVHPHGKRWRAGIRKNGYQHWLGVFDTIAEAAAARRAAEPLYFGAFAPQRIAA